MHNLLDLCIKEDELLKDNLSDKDIIWNGRNISLELLFRFGISQINNEILHSTFLLKNIMLNILRYDLHTIGIKFFRSMVPVELQAIFNPGHSSTCLSILDLVQYMELGNYYDNITNFEQYEITNVLVYFLEFYFSSSGVSVITSDYKKYLSTNTLYGEKFAPAKRCQHNLTYYNCYLEHNTHKCFLGQIDFLKFFLFSQLVTYPDEEYDDGVSDEHFNAALQELEEEVYDSDDTEDEYDYVMRRSREIMDSDSSLYENEALRIAMLEYRNDHSIDDTISN